MPWPSTEVIATFVDVLATLLEATACITSDD